MNLKLQSEKNISVILPVYNEEKCIEKTLNAVFSFLQKRSFYQFIFVDDGSNDMTPEIIRNKLASTGEDRVKLIDGAGHKGKGHAVRTGVLRAEGDYICFIDGDLAYSLTHLDALIESLSRSDIVIGSRRHASVIDKNDSCPIRGFIGMTFNIISRTILRLPFSDMQAGLKGFRRDAAQELFGLQTLNGFAFDAELIYLAQKKGFTISEIPAIVSRRHICKASKVNLLINPLEMLLNLIWIKLNDKMGKYGSPLTAREVQVLR